MRRIGKSRGHPLAGPVSIGKVTFSTIDGCSNLRIGLSLKGKRISIYHPAMLEDTIMKKLLFQLDTDPIPSVFDTGVVYGGGMDQSAGRGEHSVVGGRARGEFIPLHFPLASPARNR